MADVTPTPPTADPDVNALLYPAKWLSGNLTFSFPDSADQYERPYGAQDEPAHNFLPLNSAQRQAVNDIVLLFEGVSQVSLVQAPATASPPATLRLAHSDLRPNGDSAWTFPPDSRGEFGGDSWFSSASGLFNNPVPGNHAYSTFIHEIGHALGLKHPHEPFAGSDFGAMSAAHDQVAYTVLSYRAYQDANPGARTLGAQEWSHPQTLMMYDIAALQHLYGADYDHQPGDTTYSWDPNTGEMSIDGRGEGAPGANRVFMTVWDGDGIDTYDFSNYGTGVTADLRPGMWTTTSDAQLADLGDGRKAPGNIANALLFQDDLRSLIENVVGGSGNDVLTGNGDDNALAGGPGQDTIDGLLGFDTVDYGKRTEPVVVALDGGNPTTVKVGGADEDTVKNVEHVFGGSGNDQLAGDGNQNALFGFNGDDVLRGGMGADFLVGGEGVDTADFSDMTGPVILQLRGDEVSETTLRGDGDRVSQVENVWGGTGDDFLFGDDLDNELRGGAGHNVLNGGLSNDHLWGGGAASSSNFLFDTALDAATNLDRIHDFTPGADKIALSSRIFAMLSELSMANRVLQAEEFRAEAGAQAQDPEDRILYDLGTGTLLYDADGTGSGAAVPFAIMVSGPTLAATDLTLFG